MSSGIDLKVSNSVLFDSVGKQNQTIVIQFELMILFATFDFLRSFTLSGDHAKGRELIGLKGDRNSSHDCMEAIKYIHYPSLILETLSLGRREVTTLQFCHCGEYDVTGKSSVAMRR